MKIVIMGCGRVGSRLANMLDNEGHEVSIIDLNPETFVRLSPDFHGQTIVGTGIDEDVLKSAGIEKADAFVAVTSEDNPNIMASQIAKHVFEVPEVLCRIYDPVREDTYHLLGLDTVCPTTMISNVLREHIVTAAGRTQPAVRPPSDGDRLGAAIPYAAQPEPDAAGPAPSGAVGRSGGQGIVVQTPEPTLPRSGD